MKFTITKVAPFVTGLQFQFAHLVLQEIPN